MLVRIVASILSIFVTVALCYPVRAQTPDELLQRSLAKLRVPELEIAYSLHPTVCSIGREQDQRWSAACEGVPIHFYRQITICDPGPPKQCGLAPANYTFCRSFYWDVDASGNPSGSFGNRQFDSIEADCMPKGTLNSDRAEMAIRGIALVPEEILDYAGRYTGKPRPIK
ncbi:hypothetical protein [Bradyrhizobium sp.]